MSRKPAPRAPQAPPKTFDEAFETLTPTPEDAAALEGAGEPGEGTPLEQAAEAGPVAEGQVPPWLTLPEGLVVPEGPRVAFMRFRAAWTDAPQLGDRAIMLWTLSVADEKQAADRAAGKPGRTLMEMAQQCVRVIDGKRADWGGMWATSRGKGGFYPVDRFYTEIGARCRRMIENWYLKAHAMDERELADFFLNCLVTASATAG